MNKTAVYMVTVACITIISVTLIITKGSSKNITAINTNSLAAPAVQGAQTSQDTTTKVQNLTPELNYIYGKDFVDVMCNYLVGYECDLWGSIDNTNPKQIVYTQSQGEEQDSGDPNTSQVLWHLTKEQIKQYPSFIVRLKQGASYIADSAASKVPNKTDNSIKQNSTTVR